MLVSLTPLGLQMAQELPSPLQERFGSRLTELSADEQAALRQALNKVARMMEEEAPAYGRKKKS